MQNLIQKFRQGSIVFEKPSNLSKNWKYTIQLNIFCRNFAHVFYLLISTKECVEIFLFCLDLELFAKIKNTWFLRTRFLHFY